jgi:hypothetical protein
VGISKIVGAGEAGNTVGVSLPLSRFIVIRPQACKRNTRIKMIENLLHTLAVYHNTLWLRFRLSLSEYEWLYIQIELFTGKIAREIYLWRSECASISLSS